MGLIATQSVNVLEASSLKEAWRAVFSNMGAKVFMRLVDNETVEEATKLAGEYEVYLTSEGVSMGAQGFGTSGQTDRRELKALPSQILTQVFQKGDAVILGSLDGSDSQSVTRFIHVPKFDI
jgi:type IV secretory pathway TraG/TraD family ATPase VirD4